MADGPFDEVRRILLQQGQKRFGVIEQRHRDALEAIEDLERLERMCERMLEATSWQDLLDTP